MTRTQALSQKRNPVSATLLKVGLEVFPVYGDESTGWSLDADDFTPSVPLLFRYQSLEELFFALVNLNVSEEGKA